MDDAAEGYLCIDFESCSVAEVAASFHAFARLCRSREVSRAILKAGDNDPGAHRCLADALVRLADSGDLLIEFKLALIPSTPAIRVIYGEARDALRANGFNAWVFDGVEEAAAWLQGRSVAGAAAS